MTVVRFVLKNVDQAIFGLSRLEDTATVRALNIAATRGRKHMVNKIVEYYTGIPKGSIAKKIRIDKATKLNKRITFTGKSTRMNLVQPKKLGGKGKRGKGISHKKSGKGGRRVKITTPPESGATVPFLIKAKAGGKAGPNDIQVRGGSAKMISVYLQKRYRKAKRAKARKVTTMRGSSVARMMEKVGIEQKEMDRFIRKEFLKEYDKQLKKAKFV